jgi:dephospho-CoA kinase
MAPDAAVQALNAQRPAHSKRSESDVVIENAGSLADLERSAREVWDQLQVRAEGSNRP